MINPWDVLYGRIGSRELYDVESKSVNLGPR